jgi:prepilin-type processing-associated H-X9-DG protein
LSPLATSKTPGTGYKGFYVLPSIGAVLKSYLDGDPRVWRCPSASPEKFAITGPDPYSATRGITSPDQTDPNQFVPNYDYQCYKEFMQLAMIGGPFANGIKLREWVSRSVGGLRADRVTPLGPNNRVVLFHDRDSAYHTKQRNTNIYTSTDDWHYFGNYGYLDGHAEGHPYSNIDGYLNSIHGPINQSWCGVDFASTFTDQYAPYLN